MLWPDAAKPAPARDRSPAARMRRRSARTPQSCCARRGHRHRRPRLARCRRLSLQLSQLARDRGREGGSGPHLAAFIHIPLLARGGAVRRKGAPRITLEELVDAGEAMLMEMVGLARKTSELRRVGKGEATCPPSLAAPAMMVGTRALCPPYGPSRRRTLTLPRTIAAAPAVFTLLAASAYLSVAIPRPLPRDASWTSTAVISSEHPPQASPARLPCRPTPRARRR